MALAAVALMGCSGAQNSGEQQVPATDSIQPAKKILVAYFSASGVTRGVAERMATILDADLHEIVPEQRYTDADLDWHDKQSRSSLEMADKNSRPAIKDAKIDDIDKYETVFIGFPIWWYTAPTIINTFVEANDFGKARVIPFATSGGSTIDKACADLKEAYPTVNWQPGYLLNEATDDQLAALAK